MNLAWSSVCGTSCTPLPEISQETARKPAHYQENTLSIIKLTILEEWHVAHLCLKIVAPLTLSTESLQQLSSSQLISLRYNGQYIIIHILTYTRTYHTYTQTYTIYTHTFTYTYRHIYTQTNIHTHTRVHTDI